MVKTFLIKTVNYKNSYHRSFKMRSIPASREVNESQVYKKIY